jgi:DNA repair exonuclease SbcCD ATPase subunit
LEVEEMVITFNKLVLENFKNHKSLEIVFSDITNIEGRNGAGKSTVGDAFTWILYGTDIMGNKLEPKPIGTDEETKVELLLQVDDKQILLGRSQKKTAKYYVNEVPEKATKFNELVASLFDKDLFLSLFNPSYFPSQHWQSQRKQLLQYVSEPLNKEVLAVMGKVHARHLEEALKKHSLDDLEKIHRERFNKNDKAYARAAERVLTLQEQLEKIPVEKFDGEVIQKEIEKLRSERDALDEKNHVLHQSNSQRSRIEAQIEALVNQIKKQKQLVVSIRDEEIKETCQTCGQALDEASIKKVQENKQLRFNEEVQAGKALVKELDKLKETLAGLPEATQIDRSASLELDNQIMQLMDKLNSSTRLKQLEEEINQAKANQEKIRQERNESLGIVEAIKEFRSKQAELMVKKVDDLFEKISVRLYEEQKNGELRDTFEIEMDGKPYSKLSTAEKIKCGLELIEVLSKQSDVIVPTFVDNSESILSFKKPSGQLIVARVVDKEFEIKSVSLKEDAK